jgi:hypothetical protein
VVEKVGNGFDVHVTHILELFVLLGEEEFAVGVEYGECGNAFLNGHLIFFGYIDVVIHLSDVDVDEDEVIVEELLVGVLVEVDVEDLAVPAPITAEIEDDALVLLASLLDGRGDVGPGVGCRRVDLALDEGDVGSRSRRCGLGLWNGLFGGGRRALLAACNKSRGKKRQGQSCGLQEQGLVRPIRLNGPIV